MPADRSSGEDDPAGWAQHLPTDPPSDGPVGAPELRAALQAGSLIDRVAAVRRVLPGPGVVQAVVEALGDPAAEVRVAAIHALARLGGPVGSRALLGVSVEDPSPTVRAEAVAALGRELNRATPGASEGD